MSDRVTWLFQGVSNLLFPVQSRQKSSVMRSFSKGAIGDGGGRCERPKDNTKGNLPPAVTVNSQTVLNFSHRSSADDRNPAMSGPAIARNDLSSARVTQGMIAP